MVVLAETRNLEALSRRSSNWPTRRSSSTAARRSPPVPRLQRRTATRTWLPPHRCRTRWKALSWELGRARELGVGLLRRVAFKGPLDAASRVGEELLWWWWCEGGDGRVAQKVEEFGDKRKGFWEERGRRESAGGVEGELEEKCRSHHHQESPRVDWCRAA